MKQEKPSGPNYAHQMAIEEYRRRQRRAAERNAAKYASRGHTSPDEVISGKKPKDKNRGKAKTKNKTKSQTKYSAEPETAKAVGPKKSLWQSVKKMLLFLVSRIVTVLIIAVIFGTIMYATSCSVRRDRAKKYANMTVGEIEVAEGRMTEEEGEAYDEQLEAELTAKVQALLEEMENGKPGAFDPRIIYPQDEHGNPVLTNDVETLRQTAMEANLEPPRMYFKQTDGVPDDLEYQNKGFTARTVYPASAEIDQVVFNSVKDREVYGDERYGAYVREVGEDDGTNFYVNLRPEDVPVTVHAGSFFDVAALVLNDRTVPDEAYEAAKKGEITSAEITGRYGSTLASVHITTPGFLAKGEVANITVEIQPSPANDPKANFEGVRGTVAIKAAEDMFIERAYQTVPTFGLLRESSEINGHRMYNMLDDIEMTRLNESTGHGEIKTCIKVGRVGPSIEMGQMAICTFYAEPAKDPKVIQSFQDTVLMQYDKAKEAAENSSEDSNTTTDSEKE